MRRYKASKNNYELVVNELVQVLPGLLNSLGTIPDIAHHINRLQSILTRLSEIEKTGGFVYNEPVKILEDLKITDERTLSLLR